ncbi:MAG: protein O-mannosyl-transferase family [Streptosporangiaceae bacterium]
MATVTVERDPDRVGGPKPSSRSGGLPSLLLRGSPYVLVAAVLSVLYVRTLLPSVGFAMDTAKFGYLGVVLGTGHPPGEPLYLMLNAAWVHVIPASDPAWEANLLSAIIAVITGAVFVRVFRELKATRWMAVVGALLICVSRLFWQQSIIAEVYPLNNLFVAVELALLLAWMRTRREWLLLACLGAFELSFSNHPMGLFLIPGLAVFLYLTRGYRVLLRWRNIAVLVGCGLLTLSTYGYIVWRSLDPRTPYVELDIHDLGSFWAGITAQTFQHDMFGYSAWEFAVQRVPFAFYHMWLQFFVMTAIGIWGFVILRRRRREVAWLTGLWALAVAVFATDYVVTDAQVFYQVTWIMLGIWITLGLQDLARWVGNRLARRTVSGTASRGVSRGLSRGVFSALWARRLPVALTIAAPLGLAVVNYPQVDLSGDNTRQVIARTLAAMPRNSIVFTPTYDGFQEMNYFLVPDRRGHREHKYVELGMGKLTPDANTTLAGRFAKYCLGHQSMRLEWIRTTVPGDLHVFVYTHDYAHEIADQGFTVTHASGKLYRVSCG